MKNKKQQFWNMDGAGCGRPDKRFPVLGCFRLCELYLYFVCDFRGFGCSNYLDCWTDTAQHHTNSIGISKHPKAKKKLTLKSFKKQNTEVWRVSSVSALWVRCANEINQSINNKCKDTSISTRTHGRLS